MASISAISLNEPMLCLCRGDGVGGNVKFEPNPLVVVDVKPCNGESVNRNGRSSGNVLNDGNAELYYIVIQEEKNIYIY